MRPSLWLYVVPCDAMYKLTQTSVNWHHLLEYTSALNVLVHDKVRPLYEPGYVVPCVDNLTEENSYVSMFYFIIYYL
jgi:hypothetical protein